MSIYSRDEVLPEWEPVPYDAAGPVADKQEEGFHRRALLPLSWEKVEWKQFPENGIFGRGRDWFVGNDIVCVCTHDGEDLILIRNTWFGWSDPPEWGVASRPVGKLEAPWEMWGHFPGLPSAWTVPELT